MKLDVETVRRNKSFYDDYWHYCKYCIQLGVPVKSNTETWKEHYAIIKARR